MARGPFGRYRPTLDQRGGIDLRRAVVSMLALEREFESFRGCLRIVLSSGSRFIRTTHDPVWVRLSGRIANRVGTLSIAGTRPLVVDSSADVPLDQHACFMAAWFYGFRNFCRERVVRRTVGTYRVRPVEPVCLDETHRYRRRQRGRAVREPVWVAAGSISDRSRIETKIKCRSHSRMEIGRARLNSSHVAISY